MKRLLAAAALPLVLAACGSNTAPEADAPTTPPATSAAPATTAPALSENEQTVKTFVDALDKLGIKHTDPKRTEAALGSKASYDITINGFDAGINIFVDKDSQANWLEASDSLGGICVTIDGAALSLNSSDGVANSAEIAPKIAAEVGGTAHGN